MGERVQGLRSINARYKIDRRLLRINRKWRSQRTYMHDPWARSKGGFLEGMGVLGGGGKRQRLGKL